MTLERKATIPDDGDDGEHKTPEQLAGKTSKLATEATIRKREEEAKAKAEAEGILECRHKPYMGRCLFCDKEIDWAPKIGEAVCYRYKDTILAAIVTGRNRSGNLELCIIQGGGSGHTSGVTNVLHGVKSGQWHADEDVIRAQMTRERLGTATTVS